jgi:hypothetical protein
MTNSLVLQRLVKLAEIISTVTQIRQVILLAVHNFN